VYDPHLQASYRVSIADVTHGIAVHAAAQKASPALTDPSLNCRAQIVSWWLRQHRASPGSATELSKHALSDHGNEVSRHWHESPACLYPSAMWLPATFRAVSCIILQLVLRGHRTGARLHGYLRIQTRGIYHTAMPPVGDIAGSRSRRRSSCRSRRI
jgi:hypothetical protein